MSDSENNKSTETKIEIKSLIDYIEKVNQFKLPEIIRATKLFRGLSNEIDDYIPRIGRNAPHDLLFEEEMIKKAK